MKPTRSTIVLGLFAALAGSLTLLHSQSNSPAAPSPAPDLGKEIAALRAEVETLKAKACDQSHVMKDVAYHFGNLWFAGEKQNWALAKFYCDETRAHLKWAVRVIPVRKISTGDFDLRVMLEGLDQTAFAGVQEAINAKDSGKFVAAYKTATAACTSCHVATEKPFLRVRVPDQPEASVVDFAVP
jgi:hypothetical protein